LPRGFKFLLSIPSKQLRNQPLHRRRERDWELTFPSSHSKKNSCHPHSPPPLLFINSPFQAKLQSRSQG
jgi:hypothetical protein